MGHELRIPQGGWVVVGDGRKALVLRNLGDAIHPNLQVQQVFQAPPNPPNDEQGTDRPSSVTHGGHHSSVGQVDWHDIAEHRFAQDVADALDKAPEGPIASLVVVAPPRTLAELRRTFSDKLKRVVTAEIDKDLTKHPVYEIERYLTGP